MAPTPPSSLACTAWLVAGAAIVVAAVVLWQGRPSALRVNASAAAVSLLVCLAGLPDAYRGAVIDLAALVVASALFMFGGVAGRPRRAVL